MWAAIYGVAQSRTRLKRLSSSSSNAFLIRGSFNTYLLNAYKSVVIYSTASNRISKAEEWISELEDRMVEINEAERKKEKRIKRNEDNLRDLWVNVNHIHI